MITPPNPFYSIASKIFSDRLKSEYPKAFEPQLPVADLEPVRTSHRGSIEAHARATIAQMQPEKRWEFLQRMIAEEIRARHEAAHGARV